PVGIREVYARGARGRCGVRPGSDHIGESPKWSDPGLTPHRPRTYNRAVRLAWWSPWPPQRSGIAGRSAELVPLLAARGHSIDVFVDGTRVRSPLTADEPPSAGAVRVVNAHDFVWRQAKDPYDLAVYQVGNSHLHKFIWPYLYRYPGLAVLHDGRVHHARAEALLSAGRSNDYVE